MDNSFKEELTNLSWELRIMAGSQELRPLLSPQEIESLQHVSRHIQIEAGLPQQVKQPREGVEQLCKDAKSLVQIFEQRKDQYVIELETHLAGSEKQLQLINTLIDLADSSDTEPTKAAFSEFEELFKKPKAAVIKGV